MPQLPVAILAGGLATRLRPVTETIPKSLVSVAGEPFLAHQLRQLRAQGIESVVLCIGYLGEMIEADFGDGSAWGLRLQYSYDGPRLLGTGGALAQALPMLGEQFLVLYGDSYLPIDFNAVTDRFHQAGKLGLMTVFENRDAYDKSNVQFGGGRIIRYDKRNRTPEMLHIDYGLSVFDAAAFASKRDAGAFDLSLLQQELVAKGEMAGFEVAQRFYEIGSHEGLAELDAFLRAGKSA